MLVNHTFVYLNDSFVYMNLYIGEMFIFNLRRREEVRYIFFFF